MGGYYTPFAVDDPAALFQPRRPRFRAQRQDTDQQDLLAPLSSSGAPTGDEGEPTATPAATPAAAPVKPASRQDLLAPLTERVSQAGQALQSERQRAAAMTYQPQKRSLAGRIGEGILSMFSPRAADTIFEGPERQRYQAYQGQMQGEQERLGSLEDAYQQAVQERSFQAGEPLREAQAAYYSRRQSGPAAGKTVTKLGPDGKPHLFSYDEEAGDYSHDEGPAVEKPDTSMDDREFYNKDPEGWAKYHADLRRYAVEHRAPTDAEYRYNLYKHDPDAYNALYGGRDGSGQVDARLMTLASSMAKDELGEVDPQKALAIYDQLVQKQQQTAAARRQQNQPGKAAPPKVNRQVAPGTDLGPAPKGRKEGDTGTMQDGTRVKVRKGRLVAAAQ